MNLISSHEIEKLLTLTLPKQKLCQIIEYIKSSIKQKQLPYDKLPLFEQYYESNNQYDVDQIKRVLLDYLQKYLQSQFLKKIQLIRDYQKLKYKQAEQFSIRNTNYKQKIIRNDLEIKKNSLIEQNFIIDTLIEEQMNKISLADLRFKYLKSTQSIILENQLKDIQTEAQLMIFKLKNQLMQISQKFNQELELLDESLEQMNQIQDLPTYNQQNIQKAQNKIKQKYELKFKKLEQKLKKQVNNEKIFIEEIQSNYQQLFKTLQKNYIVTQQENNSGILNQQNLTLKIKKQNFVQPNEQNFQILIQNIKRTKLLLDSIYEQLQICQDKSNRNKLKKYYKQTKQKLQNFMKEFDIMKQARQNYKKTFKFR